MGFVGTPWTEEEHRIFLLGLQELCKRSSSLSDMIIDEVSLLSITLIWFQVRDTAMVCLIN